MSKAKAPTTADLVVLSLLCEQPMHGYHLNQELERRNVRNWAGISRAQIYYSLDKLRERGLVAAVSSDEPAAGPARQRYATTKAGRKALARGLDNDSWATTPQRPPFLTWLALSMHADEGVFDKCVAQRRAFLEEQLTSKRHALAAITADTEPVVPAAYFESTRSRAVLMVELAIDVLETELKWLERLATL